MDQDNKIECINCGNEITSEYCQSCGQPAKPERLTLLSMWSDYFGRVFNLDTKFLRTVKDLTLDPGRVSKEYVLGNRIRYIPPVSYFIIITTVLIIMLSLIDIKYSELIASSQQAINPAHVSDKQLKIQQMFNELFVKNMRTFFFLQIPFVALWGKIIFKKTGYNLLENSVLAFYTHGHLIWLGIAGALIYKFTGNVYNGATFILSAIYFSWSCAAFYTVSPPKAYFKGLLVHILTLLSFMLFLILVLLLGLVIYIKFIDPEFLNNI
jgi:hypothetical protein